MGGGCGGVRERAESVEAARGGVGSRLLPPASGPTQRQTVSVSLKGTRGSLSSRPSALREPAASPSLGANTDGELHAGQGPAAPSTSPTASPRPLLLRGAHGAWSGLTQTQLLLRRGRRTARAGTWFFPGPLGAPRPGGRVLNAKEETGLRCFFLAAQEGVVRGTAGPGAGGMLRG